MSNMKRAAEAEFENDDFLNDADEVEIDEGVDYESLDVEEDLDEDEDDEVEELNYGYSSSYDSFDHEDEDSDY